MAVDDAQLRLCFVWLPFLVVFLLHTCWLAGLVEEECCVCRAFNYQMFQAQIGRQPHLLTTPHFPPISNGSWAASQPSQEVG